MRPLGLLGIVLLVFSLGLIVYSMSLAFYADYNAASFQSSSCPPDLRNTSQCRLQEWAFGTLLLFWGGCALFLLLGITCLKRA